MAVKPLTQNDVAHFYDSLVFPSRISNPAYSRLAFQDIKHGQRVGDFGCGQSLFYDSFRNLALRPIFLDISLKALKTIDYGVRIQADICHLPIKDGAFNVIFCIGVIHHLPDMYSAIEELARAVSNEGVLVVGVYSAISFNSRLRQTYDSLSSQLLRRMLFYTTTLLAWVKLRPYSKKLVWQEVEKRVTDLLKTPLVRYLPLEYYEEMAYRVGLKVVDRKSISSMMILYLRKGA